jgi:hypothetical protein
MKAHESRHTYKLFQGALNAYIGKVGVLSKNTDRLKYAISELLQSRGQVARDAGIAYILEICDTEGIRFVPWFLHSPTSVLSKEQAYIFRDFMFSMFSLCSRDFKKYYLMPKIKQLGKLWKLDQMAEKPKTFDAVLESLESRIYQEMAEEHDRLVNLEKAEERKKARYQKEQASRIKQMFVARPTSQDIAEAWEKKNKQDAWEKENERKIAACRHVTDK